MIAGTYTPEQVEHTVHGRLNGILEQYRIALRGRDAGPGKLSALGCEIRVDRIRKIVVPYHLYHPAMWDEGTESISNQSMIGRTTLALFVGRQRHLSARQCLRVLSIIAGNDADYTGSETALCAFLNLTVVERAENAELDLPIWAALGHLFATEHLEDNVFTVMPPLLSDHDVLYRQIPATARERGLLAPGDDVDRREPLPRYQARLLSAVRPELAEQIERCATDDDRTAMFRSSDPALRAYIRIHIFGRVAKALADESPG
jgi:hypothetical protein